jgi:N-acetyl-1-D-myo-inositol-2-amino-2-deoxy-alpha-D-glucopyranoside deacetylase
LRASRQSAARLILSSVQEQFPDRPERVLFVHAHPDDETITTGGTIARLVDAGAAVTVLTCTRGELGEVIPDALKYLEGSGARLAQLREAELARAMGILGVSDHRFLGDPSARWGGQEPRRYHDSGMRWGEHGAVPLADIAPDSLCAADLAEVVRDIAAVIAQAEIEAVVSYDPTGGYGHPDHVRAHHAARRAAEALGVPFFQIEPPGARDSGGFTVDVSAQKQRKTEALRAYPSQVTVTGDRYALSSGPAVPIAAEERFRRVRSSVRPATVWGEQAPSGKLAGAVLALLTGIVVGALATVNHQVSVGWFAGQLPLGILASLGLVTALLVGLRLVFENRLLPALAAAGLLVAVGTLSLMSAGGSVLVPANALGWIWTFGAPVIALTVLSWPRLHGPRRGAQPRPHTAHGAPVDGIVGERAAKGTDPL